MWIYDRKVTSSNWAIIRTEPISRTRILRSFVRLIGIILSVRNGVKDIRLRGIVIISNRSELNRLVDENKQFDFD